MAGIASFKIEIDFGSGYVDLAQYNNVDDGRLSIKRSCPYDGSIETSVLNIVLRNKDGIFSYRNSASSYYNKLRWRIPIRIRTDYFNGTPQTVTLWTGYVDSVSYDWAIGTNQSTVTLHCVDVLALIANDSVTYPLATNVGAASTVIDTIFDELLPGGTETAVSSTTETTFPTFFADNVKAADILRQIAESDLNGKLYVSKAGILNYVTRNKFLYNGSGRATRTWGDSTNYKPIKIQETLDEKVYNKGTVSTYVYAAAAGLTTEERVVWAANLGEDNVFAYTVTQAIGPGQTLIFYPSLYNSNLGIGGTGKCEPFSGYGAAVSGTSIIPEYTPTQALVVTVEDNFNIHVTNTASATTYYLNRLRLSTISFVETTPEKKEELKIAGTAVSDATAGTVAWTNPGNATAEDTNAATITLSSPTPRQSEYLKCTNFGFAIPENVIIENVTVFVKTKFTTAPPAGGGRAQMWCSIVKGGTLIPAVAEPDGRYEGISWVNAGDFPYGPLPHVPTVLTALPMGLNPLDTTLSLLPADVNATDFGVAVALEFSNGSGSIACEIDCVHIRINYIVPADIGTPEANVKKNELTGIEDLEFSGTGVHGSSNLNLDLPWVASAKKGLDLLVEKLHVYRDPFSRLRLTFKWTTAEIIQDMAALELTDRIYYKDTSIAGASYSDNYYSIESIEHDISVPNLPETTVTLIPQHYYRDTTNIFWDNFNRFSAAYGYNPAAEYMSIIDGSFTVDAGKLKGATSGSNRAIKSMLNQPNHVVEASFTNILAQTGTKHFGVLARGTSTLSAYFALTFNSGSLYFIENGTTLSSTSYTVSDREVFKIVCYGYHVMYYVNGDLRYTYIAGTQGSAFSDAAGIIMSDAATYNYGADFFMAEGL